MIIDQTGCLVKGVIRTRNKQLTIVVDTPKRADAEEEEEVSYIRSLHAAQLPFLLEQECALDAYQQFGRSLWGLRLLFSECVSDAEDHELLLSSMMRKTSDCHRY